MRVRKGRRSSRRLSPDVRHDIRAKGKNRSLSCKAANCPTDLRCSISSINLAFDFNGHRWKCRHVMRESSIPLIIALSSLTCNHADSDSSWSTMQRSRNFRNCYQAIIILPRFSKFDTLTLIVKLGREITHISIKKFVHSLLKIEIFLGLTFLWFYKNHILSILDTKITFGTRRSS